jgi:hypothetical protein
VEVLLITLLAHTRVLAGVMAALVATISLAAVLEVMRAMAELALPRVMEQQVLAVAVAVVVQRREMVTQVLAAAVWAFWDRDQMAQAVFIMSPPVAIQVLLPVAVVVVEV